MKTENRGRLDLLRAGLFAARANLVPGIVLISAAVLVVVGYYVAPPVTEVLNRLAVFKEKYGVLYSIPSTSLFAGLIPFIYMRCAYSKENRPTWGQGLFFVLFWGYRGFEVDIFYNFQSWLFGSAATFSTVLCKVLVDQFVYNPVWAVPMQGIAFYWKDSHFRFSAFRRFDWKRFFLAEVPVILISVWAVWIPAVTVIYCLPTPLQLPLNNLVACFWTLLLTGITKK